MWYWMFVKDWQYKSEHLSITQIFDEVCATHQFSVCCHTQVLFVFVSLICGHVFGFLYWFTIFGDI
jgi:hypothetical protein